MISYYELLGMVKDKTNPKKVKYDGNIFEWNSMNYYCDDIGDYLNGCMHEIDSFEKNIEIIEEDKDIEEIPCTDVYYGGINNLDEFKKTMEREIKFTSEKINELVREVNKLRKDTK